MAQDLAPSRNCPLCGSADKEAIYLQRFADESGLVPFEACEVVVCAECGMGYADGIPPQAELDEYYRTMSKYEYQGRGGEETPHERERFDETARFLAEHLPDRQASLLDVGCATGGLLRALREEGFQNLAGLDPSPVCVKLVQERGDARAIEGALHDLPALGEQWDVVCATHVLEHVEDLGEALTALRTAVREGGWLFVEVPDVTGFCESRSTPFWEFSIEHINFFSPVSLENLLRQAGFAPRVAEQTSQPVHAQAEVSVVRCLAAKTQPGVEALALDKVSGPALREYVARSEEADAALLGRIAEIAAGGRPIVVWGAGAHTLRLLKISDLPRAKVVAYVDSNPHYQGQVLCGAPVAPPEWLRGREEPVLVSSWVYQDEIAHTIREDLGYANELILLYPPPGAAERQAQHEAD